jgi:hypothetical protein
MEAQVDGVAPQMAAIVSFDSMIGRTFGLRVTELFAMPQ